MADAIVVAAGGSTRMGGVDKRIAPLAGRPVLAWTLDAIAAAASVERIVLVLPEGALRDALAGFLPANVVAIVPGGEHRGASVARGLDALDRLDGDTLDPGRVVLIHDGARPLVPVALVEAVAAAAAEFGAAVPVVPVSDTLRRVQDGRLGDPVDRTDLVAAQTPQGARRGLLRAAFDRFPPDSATTFTDEAGLLAACTIPVHPMPGDPVNLKITLPADLERAERWLAATNLVRTGIGRDWHPFGPGSPLRLGGVDVVGAPRLHGHSDGDVALHAVADALLGAAALGDLGRLFPADTRTPRGIASTELLAATRDRLATDGWRARSVDLTIEGSRPSLRGHLEAMRAAIAAALDLAPAAVGVKASTGNLAGDGGAGRGMGATAVVTIERFA